MKQYIKINMNYFIYSGAYELTVYSMKRRRSWRLSHRFFQPVPELAKLSVAGYNFQWNDGIFSAELTDIKPNGFSDLYFHPMASTSEYKISTKILRNERLATADNSDAHFKVRFKYMKIIKFYLFVI